MEGKEVGGDTLLSPQVQRVPRAGAEASEINLALDTPSQVCCHTLLSAVSDPGVCCTIEILIFRVLLNQRIFGFSASALMLQSFRICSISADFLIPKFVSLHHPSEVKLLESALLAGVEARWVLTTRPLIKGAYI